MVHMLRRHSLAGCWKPSITRFLDPARLRARSSRTIDRSSRESHELLSSDEKIQRIRLDHLDDLAVTSRTTWPQRSHFFYYCRFFSWDRCTLFPVDSVVCGFVFFLIDIVRCCYNFAEWNVCRKCDAVWTAFDGLLMIFTSDSAPLLLSWE